MLCSSFIKERLYIGEATVATICGVIFGPHAANLINPGTWGNTDQITLEFSRIVLVVQCFAVGVELPKYYMEKHWRSVVFLLIPVMTFGWLITSLFIWWLIPPLNWLESLCCAACVTATDPVLASSVVGKGKFAKRVPKHLRDVLSAESGCNDGMAFPFIYLALYLIDYRPDADKVARSWIVITILYECVFGAFYGFVIGYIGRHGIKYAEKHDLVDRESFLVFYFVLALFCAGSGSIIGVDDLLVGFSAGVGFSNDGWFTQKTEESHVSNVIDLLLNLAYFVYLGTIIPWEQYNNPGLGTTPWRLVVIALFVIFFRRIPIMMALKPVIPDIKTWREALFAGHFGPIGVGAIFVAILARAELETGGATPLSSYPDAGVPNATLVALIWPITTFLVIASIIVHGSSIAVFTLGKHINTLALTMSYTTGAPGDDGPMWLSRLPRISSTSRSQAKSFASETDADELKKELPPGTLPGIGVPGEFLRRQKEEDNPSRQGSRASSLVPRRRKKKWDDGRGPGGPISQSAIYPQRRSQSENMSEQTSDTLTPGDTSPNDSPAPINDDDERKESELGAVQDDPEMREILRRNSEGDKRDRHKSNAQRHPERAEVYDEGDHIIIENEDGDVLKTVETPKGKERKQVVEDAKEGVEQGKLGYMNLRKVLGVWRNKEEGESSDKGKKSKGVHRKGGAAMAYQFGNTIIVEDEDGEVVKTYELPPPKQTQTGEPGPVRTELDRMATWTGLKKPEEAKLAGGSSNAEGTDSVIKQGINIMGNWGFSGKNTNKEDGSAKDGQYNEDDDRHIRFKIGGAGRRLTKEDFLKEIQSLDPKARWEIIQESDAPDAMKDMAKQDADHNSPGSSRIFGAKASGTGASRRGADVDGDESSDSDSDRARRRKAKATSDASRMRPDAFSEPPSGKRLATIESDKSDEMHETPAERKRREKALKGVGNVTDAQRGRSRPERMDSEGEVAETPAEKRRRLAALGAGSGADEDSDDDDTPRVPPPVARSRGIRFAQSPVRGKR